MNQPEQMAYTVHEASRVLGTSESAVRAMVQRKQIPVTRIGRRVFILRSEIDQFLRGQIVVDSRS